MAPVTPFRIDEWNSCVNPLSLTGLQSLAADSKEVPLLELDRPLGYGAVLGSRKLRETIASVCTSGEADPITWEGVLVTQGAISANFLVLSSLCGPGDHIICQYPTYQQLYEVPRHAGADVSLWKLTAEKEWLPDLDELQTLVQSNTKMIIINNPCNPTGAAIPRPILEGLVAFAAERDIMILSDEVFRPLFYTEIPPPSILALGYQNVICTGSTSKGYALPGLRVGWIASPNKAVIAATAATRDYTTIAVSQLDDQIACYALTQKVRARIVVRSLAIARENLRVLEAFVEEYAFACDWVRPTGGAVAFVRVSKDGVPVDDNLFCKMLLASTGTLIVPAGFCFGTEQEGDFKGYLRIGFVSEPSVLINGLASLGTYLKDEFRVSW
ncbi:MAG: hypothetical protein M1818_008044 [Claussenomyces sp. TS43310]|nr:MAG: hypothetical protein M1818_008044 [Claussenomyces sp. TS43310]